MSGNLAVVPPALSLIGAVMFLFFPRSGANAVKAAGIYLFGELLFSIFLAWKTFENGFIVTAIGGWSAPFGIILVIDQLSALMLTAANLIFFAAGLFFLVESRGRQENPFRISLIFFMQAGAGLSLAAGDYFNLFVAYEVMLVSSYAIIAAETDEKASKHVYHYLILSIVGSGLFLVSVAMVYGYTQTLNMAALSLRLQEMGNDPKVLAISLFAFLVFALKGGIFPFYFWLPDSYSALPGSLAGLFSGILTKVSVYVLLRLSLTVFPRDLPYVSEIILALSGFTMFLGVLGAISRSSIRGILCYHILSQLGYIFMGIGCFTVTAVGAAVFFAVHNMVVKASLLLIGGLLYGVFKTDKLKDLGGVSAVFPVVAALFMLQALSLAGIPPFSGFWGKYILFTEGLAQERYLLVFFAAATSFLTLYSMVKIWCGAFMGMENRARHGRMDRNLITIAGGLVLCALVMGLGAEMAVNLTEKAASQLFDKENYTRAVLGGGK